MSDTAAPRWYARPVVCVASVPAAVGFYLDRLGFQKDWEFAEAGEVFIAQVSRDGCELILSSQWPERRGRSLLFLSLDPRALDALREVLTERGVTVKDGWWGYRLMVVEDPDGNTLYFNYPNDGEASP